MKFGNLVLIFCLIAIALCQDTEENAKPRHLGLLRRGALTKNQAKPASTTTLAPKEEISEEYDDEEAPLEEEIAENEPEPTSTESSKKIGGVVRPFRSNDDLLAALKRRRAEAANGKINLHESTTSTRAPESNVDNSIGNKNSLSGRRRFNSVQKVEQTPQEESTPAAVKANRNRFSGRGIYKTNAALTDNHEITGLESKQRAVEVRPRSTFKRF